MEGMHLNEKCVNDSFVFLVHGNQNFVTGHSMSNVNSEIIYSIWRQIPSETDVLITHDPPYGILDTTRHKEHVD